MDTTSFLIGALSGLLSGLPVGYLLASELHGRRLLNMQVFGQATVAPRAATKATPREPEDHLAPSVRDVEDLIQSIAGQLQAEALEKGKTISPERARAEAERMYAEMDNWSGPSW